MNESVVLEPLWTLITGDSLVELPWLPRLSATLIFADPPYNIGVDYGEGKYMDRMPDRDYVCWTQEWIAQTRGVLASNGSLWILISDEFLAEHILAVKHCGYKVRNLIKWYETFGVNCEWKFNRTSRTLIYAVKNNKDFIFNRDAVTVPSARQTIYNDARANPAGKVMDDVWTDIPRLAGTHKERLPLFPTQLPLALLRRVILCTSNVGDLVVDPFAGSSTTGVTAIESGRRYLGIEKRQNFADASRERLRNVQAFE